MPYQSPIATFTVNGESYSQDLDLSNDSVYLTDSKNTRLLEFTSDTEVFELTPTRKRIGHYQLRQNNWWLVDDIQGAETMGTSFNDPDGLLKDEVTFSKQWLANKDKYAVQTKPENTGRTV